MDVKNKTWDIHQLRGIIPPMVTPLLDQKTLDENGISRLVAHIVKGGVHGLFVLGTTGETPSMSYQVREELLRQVAEELAGKIPLLAGILDTSLAESIRFAEIAKDAGADAVVATPPYYFPVSQQALFRFFKKLSEEVTLPLFLYNISGPAKVVMEPDTVLRLLNLPNIVGYKDSTGDMVAFHQLQLGLKRETVYLTGPEELLAESVLLGGHGGVNGGANVFPQLYVQLYEAAVRQDVERVLVLHRKVMQLSAALYHKGGRGKSVTQGIKAALAALDICNDAVALPLSDLTIEEKREIAQYIERLDFNL